MNRYDRFPTGANTQETALNSTNVNAARFGKLYSYYVDGAVYAQPLYVPAVRIAGQGTHNVLYVATMNDKIYAFDADRSGPPLWMRDFTNEIAGVTPVPIIDITNSNDLNIVGNAGIESTPVIDTSAGMIYLVARTKENGRYVQRLHKLDITDGKDEAPPVTIEASVNSSARDAGQWSAAFRSEGRPPTLSLSLGAGNDCDRVGFSRRYSAVPRVDYDVRRPNSETDRCIVHYT
jgi:hypothetical protein